jgi:hypothetical protein
MTIAGKIFLWSVGIPCEVPLIAAVRSTNEWSDIVTYLAKEAASAGPSVPRALDPLLRRVCRIEICFRESAGLSFD